MTRLGSGMVMRMWMFMIFSVLAIVRPTGQTDSPPEIPCAIPPQIFDQMLAGNKLVGARGLTWPRRVITVAFNGGSDALYSLIEEAAAEWTSRGGVTQFSFRNPDKSFRRWTTADASPVAAIRIAFNTAPPMGGYWSALGVMADNVSANEPTLNLDGFPQKLQPYFNGRDAARWRASYEHSVVLHEFGHALGLSHEHFHPDCQKDLKLEDAVAYLMGKPNNWSEQQARFNLDAGYYFKVVAHQARGLDSTHVISANIDRTSVMLYNLKEDYYESKAKSPCKPTPASGFATTLSDGDRQFYLAHYAKIRSPF